MLQYSDEKQQIKQSFCIFHLSYRILGFVPNTEMFFSGQRELLLTQKMIKQTYVALRLNSLIHRLYCRHHELIDRYEICIPQTSRDIYHLC
jgi:hypothetical protein